MEPKDQSRTRPGKITAAAGRRPKPRNNERNAWKPGTPSPPFHDGGAADCHNPAEANTGSAGPAKNAKPPSHGPLHAPAHQGPAETRNSFHAAPAPPNDQKTADPTKPIPRPGKGSNMPNHHRCAVARNLPRFAERQWVSWITRNELLMTTFINNRDRDPICICQHYRMMIASFNSY